MEFHPHKCQLLRITNKINPIKSIYKIHDIPVSETNAAKYLGVLIDSNLNWRSHYNHVIKSCSTTLAFIKRNLSQAPKFVKAKCYTSLVRPKLEYACAVWDPHCKTHIESLEKVQKRAGRFVTGNYQMESGNSRQNREDLGWQTLEERRLMTKLLLFQKSRLNQIDIPLDHLRFKTRQTRQGGDGLTYHRDFSRIDGHIFSFYPHTTLLWNHLPPELRGISDMDTFSDMLKSTDLTAIKHSMSVNY